MGRFPSCGPCLQTTDVAMRFFSYSGFIASALVGATASTAALTTAIPREGTLKSFRGEFTSNLQQDVKIQFVRNSGVCETTPGVGQLSGYVDVGTNMSMWFWFFEARESPETAPFTLWHNMARAKLILMAKLPFLTLSGTRWNNLSNIIYIDQPIGTGFSFGTIDVNSTFAAAPAVWTAFQVLFESEEFAKFQSREFIFATESYGGHYGPEFVTYFDEQNTKIRNGELKGEEINVSALMINNGWYDPLIQNEAYVEFATFAPGYGQLQSDEVLAQLNQSFFGPGGCKDQELACYAAGEAPDSNSICRTADDFCIENVFVPAVGDRDSDDLRQNASSPNPFPPEFYVKFLRNATIMEKIGAQARYSECSNPVDSQFSRTGDDARTLLPQLAALANSRLRILIWAGDADINCNWIGGHHSVLAMDWYGNETLNRTPFTNMTIHGKPVAAIQNVDNFSFARVYEAGHEVPAFQPQAAFEIFSQIIRKEQLHSVP
ncbi:hypothetical protein ACG7TL_002194 [Trametes sanguinea]